MPGEDPGQRDLRGCGLAAFGDDRDQVDQLLVRSAGFLGESGQLSAQVAFGEGGGAVDGAGEEAFAEGAERYEPDAELDQGGQDLGFGFTPEQRVLALQGGDGLDGVGAADDVDASLGEAEVTDLAGVDEVLDSTGDVLDRHVGVDAVLVEQVDPLGVEPLQGVLGGGADVLGAAVQAGGAAAVVGEAELGGDHHVVPDSARALPTSSSLTKGP